MHTCLSDGWTHAKSRNGEWRGNRSGRYLSVTLLLGVAWWKITMFDDICLFWWKIAMLWWLSLPAEGCLALMPHCTSYTSRCSILPFSYLLHGITWRLVEEDVIHILLDDSLGSHSLHSLFLDLFSAVLSWRTLLMVPSVPGTAPTYLHTSSLSLSLSLSFSPPWSPYCSLVAYKTLSLS